LKRKKKCGPLGRGKSDSIYIPSSERKKKRRPSSYRHKGRERKRVALRADHLGKADYLPTKDGEKSPRIKPFALGKGGKKKKKGKKQRPPTGRLGLVCKRGRNMDLSGKKEGEPR